jgi:hypothetical protein
VKEIQFAVTLPEQCPGVFRICGSYLPLAARCFSDSLALGTVHRVARFSLIPRLNLHPPPTPSSAIVEPTSITDLTVQTTAKLRHIIE